MTEWLTIECERALYVDRGRNVILCDRLPSPVTLVVKLASCDGRRMVETGTGSMRSTTSAVPSETSADAKGVSQ